MHTSNPTHDTNVYRALNDRWAAECFDCEWTSPMGTYSEAMAAERAHQPFTSTVAAFECEHCNGSGFRLDCEDRIHYSDDDLSAQAEHDCIYGITPCVRHQCYWTDQHSDAEIAAVSVPTDGHDATLSADIAARGVKAAAYWDQQTVPTIATLNASERAALSYDVKRYGGVVGPRSSADFTSTVRFTFPDLLSAAQWADQWDIADRCRLSRSDRFDATVTVTLSA